MHRHTRIMLFFCFVNMFFTLLMAKNRPTLCKEIQCTMLFGENMKIAPNPSSSRLGGGGEIQHQLNEWVSDLRQVCRERERNQFSVSTSTRLSTTFDSLQMLHTGPPKFSAITGHGVCLCVYAWVVYETGANAGHVIMTRPP